MENSRSSSTSSVETEPQASPEWRSWSPPFATHVRGEYERRTFDQETGMPNPQEIRMECTKCGAKWKTMCASGQTRRHIMSFGTVHLHRDPLKPEPRVKKSGG